MNYNLRKYVIGIMSFFIITDSTAQYSDYHKIEYCSGVSELERFDNLFCRVSDNYISVEGLHNGIRILTFSEDGKLINTKEVTKIGEFKRLKFYSSKLVNGDIVIYFMAKDISTPKGKMGLYSSIFSIDNNSLGDSKLIDEFELKTTPDRLLIVQSVNREYIGFIIEPEISCKAYSYSLLVLNSVGEKALVVYNVEGEFEECYEFSEVNITNKGSVYLTYKESVNFIGGTRAFLEESSRTAWIKHDLEGDKRVSYFKDPAKNILQFRLISYQDTEVYFFSWFLVDDHSKVGISFLDAETKIENPIYEFNPEFLQPFIERKGSNDGFSDDVIQKNPFSTAKVNAYIDLLNIFYFNGDEYLLLEKRTPVRIKVVSGNSTSSLYMDVEGDLFLLNTNTGSIQKIERLVASKVTPRGVYSLINNSTISCFYYSLPPGEKENFPVDSPTKGFLGSYRAQDLYLYRSDFNLLDETVSHVELKSYTDDQIYLSLSLQRAIYEQNNLTILGHASKIRQTVTIPINQE